MPQQMAEPRCLQPGRFWRPTIDLTSTPNKPKMCQWHDYAKKYGKQTKADQTNLQTKDKNQHPNLSPIPQSISAQLNQPNKEPNKGSIIPTKQTIGSTVQTKQPKGHRIQTKQTKGGTIQTEQPKWKCYPNQPN